VKQSGCKQHTETTSLMADFESVLQGINNTLSDVSPPNTLPLLLLLLRMLPGRKWHACMCMHPQHMHAPPANSCEAGRTGNSNYRHSSSQRLS
jgi:hypothetical protein